MGQLGSNLEKLCWSHRNTPLPSHYYPPAHTDTDAYRIITLFLQAGDYISMVLISNQAQHKEKKKKYIYL